MFSISVIPKFFTELFDGLFELFDIFDGVSGTLD